ELMTDALTDSADAAFDSRGVSESFEARTTVAWSPNATMTITGDVGLHNLRYPDSALLQGTDAYGVGISASKRLSARTSVGIQGRLTDSHPADGSDTSVR